ncbi:MAG TPA: LytTR family DNA-binding domain-containing protein [Crocinitomicaceae bacterium]|nr:LytTR family DNA-binding domain-containing protein [Crocinitomicaceae bacterium]
MKLRSLIIDDELLARKNLTMLIQEYCPEIEIIGEAENKEDAKAKIAALKPDVVFLDIRMPSEAEGLDLLNEIENKDFFVVFVTAFKDYALRAFNASAVHYILKPIDIEDLQLAVSKLVTAKQIFEENPDNFITYFNSLKNLSDTLVNNKKNNQVVISHTKGLKVVEDDTIMYLDASGNCTTIYFNDGTRYLDTRTLKIYESVLDPDKFFRIHKSHIINLKYLKEFVSEDGFFVVLKNDAKMPVARNRSSDFVKYLKKR